MNCDSANLLLAQCLPGQENSNVNDLRNNIWPTTFSFWVAIGYLALVIIRPWEELFPWMAAIRFERLYLILLLLAALVAQKKQPIQSFQSITVLFFLCAMLLSCFSAYNFTMAWDTIYIYLAFVIFYFVLLMVVRTPYELVFTVAVYISVMTLYLGKSQWEFWIHGRHRYTMGVVRMVGIESSYGGPNSVAMSIVVSLPFAFFLWRYRKKFVALWPEKWAKRYFLILKIYWILAISSLVLTNSRSGIVGGGCFFMLMFFSYKGFFKKIAFICLCAVLLGIAWQVIPEENKGRIETIWAPEKGPANAKESADGRIDGFWAGIDMFSRYPMFGVGVGNFVAYRVNHLDGIPLQAHNLAGQILGELGIVGTSSFVVMILAIFVSCRRIKKLARERIHDPTFWVGFSTACRDSVILLFFMGLFGHNMLRYNWLLVAFFAVKGAYFLGNFIETEGSGANHANGKNL